jgi:regulator of protease activity HflC (stomatin/prohibitin superfamily)
MKRIITIIMMVFVTSFGLMSCERIDAGYRGVKVNLYGDAKGVSQVTEVTGMVWYNPFTQSVYEFPISVRHKEYKDDESFVVNSKDGSEFKVSPILNYNVDADKIPYIFGKYRKSIDEIEEGFLKTAIYDAFRLATNSYNADSLIGNRESYEIKVKTLLVKALREEGFIVQQFTSNLEYPNTFKNAIEAKNNAVQKALQAENDVRTAEANAKIRVVKAEGEARSLIARAKAEAEANELRQRTLTPLLIQQQWIEKWDGKVSQYSMGNGANPMIMLPK